jgi:RNA-binding protein YhbY
VVRVGKSGLTEAVLRSVEQALTEYRPQSNVAA